MASHPGYVWDGAAWVPFTGPEGKAGPGIHFLPAVADSTLIPPTGRPGDAIVTQDNGHIYIWDKPTTSWIDGGKFQGEKGPAGDTLKINGFVANAIALDPNPVHLSVYMTQDTSHLYAFDPSSLAAIRQIDIDTWKADPTNAGKTYDGAPAGYVDLGKVQGPMGPIGMQGIQGPPGIKTIGTHPGEILVWRSPDLSDPTQDDWFAEDATTKLMDDIMWPAVGQRDGKTLVYNEGLDVWALKDEDFSRLSEVVKAGTPRPGDGLYWDGRKWTMGATLNVPVAAVSSSNVYVGTLPLVGADINDPVKLYGMDADTLPSPATTPPRVGDMYLNRTDQDIVHFEGTSVTERVMAKMTDEITRFINGDQAHLIGNQFNHTGGETTHVRRQGLDVIIEQQMAPAPTVIQLTGRAPNDYPAAMSALGMHYHLEDPDHQKSGIPVLDVNAWFFDYTVGAAEAGDWGRFQRAFKAAFDASSLSRGWTCEVGTRPGIIVTCRTKTDIEKSDSNGNAFVKSAGLESPTDTTNTHFLRPDTVGVQDVLAGKITVDAPLTVTHDPGRSVIHIPSGVLPSTLTLQIDGHRVSVTTPGNLSYYIETRQGAMRGDALVYDGRHWHPQSMALLPSTATHTAGEQLVLDQALLPVWSAAGYTKAEIDDKVTKLVSGLEHGAAVKSIQDNPPTTPVQYELYIVGKRPSGDWAVHANELAEWDGTAWVFRAPTAGETHLNEVDGGSWTWNATAGVWSKISNGVFQFVTTVPVGTIVHSVLSEAEFTREMGTMVGEWVLCDGRAVAGSDYATATGRGNVPDLRGAYFRMAGVHAQNPAYNGGTLNTYYDQRTKMPDVPFAVAQGGAHHHTVTPKRADVSGGWQGLGDLLINPQRTNISGAADFPMNTSEAGQHTHTLTGGDSETRPNTYAVNYYIKIKKTPDPVLPAGPVGPVGPAGTSVTVWQGTQTAYDTIGTTTGYEPETLYLIEKP
jgi:hypothetical protein